MYTWQLACRERLTATDELVVETHIECSVSSRSESLAHLADNIPGTTVVIAHRILDLHRVRLLANVSRKLYPRPPLLTS